jgi:hypothetical protein
MDNDEIEEQILLTKENIELFLGDESKGTGTLSITDKKIVWRESKPADELHVSTSCSLTFR